MNNICLCINPIIYLSLVLLMVFDIWFCFNFYKKFYKKMVEVGK
jgi:hypothetical protein